MTKTMFFALVISMMAYSAIAGAQSAASSFQHHNAHISQIAGL
jgi:outer membrane lipoprotein-sorting protein